MRVSVVGCGYLGTVHASCLAKSGHDVVGVDVLEETVAALDRGEPTFFEPGLTELLSEGVASGRLRFTTDVSSARDATVHFICVGTPQRPNGLAADLSFLHAAVDALLPILKPGDVVVGKSTVPVGTAEVLAARIRQQEADCALIWNPEFLREGHAVDDSLRPDRLVYGFDRADPVDLRAARLLDEVYAEAIALGTPKFEVDLATAQLVKVAANSFLATKISFINAMAELCHATGADVTELADAIGVDTRIGRSFLNAGAGFGGGCLPKDIRAFVARADELGVGEAVRLLREVDAINQGRRGRLVELARQACGGEVTGRRIAVLGAAFKPGSDDVRDSPALEIAEMLRSQGALVTVVDPRATEPGRSKFPQLSFASSVEEAVTGAEVTMLLTEWPEYVGLDPQSLRKWVRNATVIDGRNCLDPVAWRAADWVYLSIGRP